MKIIIKKKQAFYASKNKNSAHKIEFLSMGQWNEATQYDDKCLRVGYSEGEIEWKRERKKERGIERDRESWR